MSDLVVTVRQISNYPATTAASSGDNLLMQQGGPGAPYASINAADLVATALYGGPSMGVGMAPPGNAIGGGIFTGQFVMPTDGAQAWNAYVDTNFDWRLLTAGSAGSLGWDQNGFNFEVATGGGAGQTLAWVSMMRLDNAGNLGLPYGTIGVARDPAANNEVVTLNYLANNTVSTFNNRNGAVQLNAQDVYNALKLCDPIATQPWVQQAINNSIQNLLYTCPFVNTWNGRKGSVYLMLSDITTVFYQSGQQPISPTPAAGSNDDSIATTKWVTEIGGFLPLTGGRVSPGKLYTGDDVSWSGELTSSGMMGWLYTLPSIVAGAPPDDGGMGITSITRASDYNVAKFGGNPQAYSITAFALADITTGTAEAAYLEARSVVPNATAIALEMDVGNYGGPTPTINPYQVINTGASIGLVIAAGGDPSTPGPSWDSSAGIAIGRNATKFYRGIVVGADSLVGEDGVTGSGIAVELGHGHEIRWTVDTNGTRAGFIRSDTSAGANSLGLIFNTNALSFVTSNPAETTLATLTNAGNFNSWTISSGSWITSGAGYVVAGSAGPSINAGVGAATGVQPNGSLWLRTDGAVGTHLYVSAGGGVWNAVAGV